MTKSQDGSSGCFSSIVRLLLCKGKLQTHSSYQITEPKKVELIHVTNDPIPISQDKAQAPGTPGVVAKLMGLESLPDANWCPKGRTPDSVTRSRSVNFMDYLLEFDLAQGQHRPVRTSASFREVPTLVNQQNHDFFVVCLNAAENANKLRPVQKESEMGVAEKKRIKNEEKSGKKIHLKEARVIKKEMNHGNKKKISKLKGEPRGTSDIQSSRLVISGKEARFSPSAASPGRKEVSRKSDEKSNATSPVRPRNHQKEVLVESKFMKKIKNKHTIGNVQSPDRSSQDSSPVSVLGTSEFYEEKTSSYDNAVTITRSMKPKSKKKSSAETGFLISHPTGCSTPSGLDTRVTVKNGYVSSEILNVDYYIELARKLYKMTEEDFAELNWRVKNVSGSGEFEEICADFGQTILDLLLNQAVEDLAE